MTHQPPPATSEPGNDAPTPTGLIAEQMQAHIERLTLLVQVFRLTCNDPSYIDWTTEELQTYHDELSAAAYLKAAPPEWTSEAQ